jgi:hypothetical protein
MKMKRLGVVALMAMLLTGCSSGPRYTVGVGSVSSGTGVGRQYVLASKHAFTSHLAPGGSAFVPVDGATPDPFATGDLEFDGYAKYVQIMLAEKGYKRVEHGGDMIITLDYEISNPAFYPDTYAEPQWDRASVKSSTPQENMQRHEDSEPDSETPYDTSSYRVTEYINHREMGAVYTREIRLEARTWNKAFLWKTAILSCGSSDDFKRVFPAMIAASGPYVASNTEQSVVIKIKDSDKRVENLRSQYGL